MKFSCGQCQTKYSIPDERVRGKVLKIRCTKCGELIAVRGEGARPPTSEMRVPVSATGERASVPAPAVARPAAPTPAAPVSKLAPGAPAKAAPAPAGPTGREGVAFQEKRAVSSRFSSALASKGEPAPAAPVEQAGAAEDSPFGALLAEASGPTASKSAAVFPLRERSREVREEPREAERGEERDDEREAERERERRKEQERERERQKSREKERERKREAEKAAAPPDGGVEWFYSKGGKQTGPVTASEMQELISSRVIGQRTYVWRDGMDDWSRLSTVAEFAEAVAAAAPATPAATGEVKAEKAAPASGGKRSGVSEAARRRDAELDEKIASSGVFDDLLRDLDGMKKDGAAARDGDDRFRAVAGLPVAPDDAAPRAAKTKGEAADAAEDLPFETGAREPAHPAAESAIFESSLEEEARRQAEEIAVVEAEEAAKRARQMAIAEISRLEEPEPPPEPRESTRVFILKAGLSKKSRMKRVAVAAVIATVVLGGLVWLTSAKFNTIYNLGLTIVKPQYAKPQSTEEISMTPDERERYRKLMLGIEEEKKQDVVKKKAAVVKKTGQAFGITGVDLVDTKGMVTGIGKEDVVFGGQRLDGDKVAGIDLGGLGVAGAGAGIEKRDGPLDLNPDLGAVFKELSADQVGRVVTSNQRSIRYCYEKHLKADSNLSGRVLIWAEVQGSGKVSKVKSLTDRIRGTMIEECLLKEIGKWQFPKFEASATAIEIPLVLTATN